MNFWKMEKNAVQVEPKLPRIYTDNYEFGNNKINVELNSTAKLSGSQKYIDVFCKNQETMTIFHAGCKTIILDVEITIPEQYKICFSLTDYWVSKGLMVNNNEVVILESGDSSINVFNINDNPVFVEPKDKLGKIWIEPVYFLNVI